MNLLERATKAWEYFQRRTPPQYGPLEVFSLACHPDTFSELIEEMKARMGKIQQAVYFPNEETKPETLYGMKLKTSEWISPGVFIVLTDKIVEDIERGIEQVFADEQGKRWLEHEDIFEKTFGIRKE